jgi:hypothetical protein
MILSRGPGTAIEFALTILGALTTSDNVETVSIPLVIPEALKTR